MPNSTPHSKRVKLLTKSEITELLRDQTGPVRLASLSANGFPLISTIWLLRGQGLATLDLEDGERVTELMINRYMKDRSGPATTAIRTQIPTEYSIAMKPRWVRGQGAVLRRKKA